MDLMHLMPPRKFTMKSQNANHEEEDQKLKKAMLAHKEE
jgi:hypothetical protein